MFFPNKVTPRLLLNKYLYSFGQTYFVPLIVDSQLHFNECFYIISSNACCFNNRFSPEQARKLTMSKLLITFKAVAKFSRLLPQSDNSTEEIIAVAFQN